MSEVVLDASVLLKWFRAQGERHREAALGLYGQFARGELLVVVPPLLFLELLNVAARRWGWEIERLERFAADLGRIGLVVRHPRWAASPTGVGRGSPRTMPVTWRWPRSAGPWW